MKDLELLQKTVLFGPEDVSYLRMSREVLEDQVDAILDTWYGFVAATPHLLYYFSNVSDGKPDERYLAEVRKRFGQWILDTAAADYDQKWLDYQHEIGRRHHRTAKNRTDGAQAPEIIHFRYLNTLFYPITMTLRPFLSKKGHSPEEVDRMHQAWQKSVLIQTTLWSQPYVKPGDY